MRSSARSSNCRAPVEDCTPASLAQCIIAEYLDVKRQDREVWLQDLIGGQQKSKAETSSR